MHEGQITLFVKGLSDSVTGPDDQQSLQRIILQAYNGIFNDASSLGCEDPLYRKLQSATIGEQQWSLAPPPLSSTVSSDEKANQSSGTTVAALLRITAQVQVECQLCAREPLFGDPLQDLSSSSKSLIVHGTPNENLEMFVNRMNSALENFFRFRNEASDPDVPVEIVVAYAQEGGGLSSTSNGSYYGVDSTNLAIFMPELLPHSAHCVPTSPKLPQ